MNPKPVQCDRIRKRGALIWARGSGPLGLRVLAPLPFAHDPNQRNFADSRGFARPFLPSSRLPLVGLRVERIAEKVADAVQRRSIREQQSQLFKFKRQYRALHQRYTRLYGFQSHGNRHARQQSAALGNSNNL